MSKFQPKDPSQDGHKKNNEFRPQKHGIQPRQMSRSMGRTMGRSMNRLGSLPNKTLDSGQDKTHQEESSVNNSDAILENETGLVGENAVNENLKDPKPKTLENACPGDVVLMPDGTTAIMMEEVEVMGAKEDSLAISIDLESNSTINPETELIKMGVLETFKLAGKDAEATAELIKQDRIEKGYTTSQKGKTSKFPTEQRQVKFYRADGNEELKVITQAKNAGNFDPGDSNKGIKRTGETKFTKGLKGVAEATGLAGDFIDLASALKGLADGDIDAVLAAAPFLGPVFAGINAQSDEVMRDFQARKFMSLLLTGEIEQLSDFLKRNPEVGLEVIYLEQSQIDAIKNGKQISKSDLLGVYYPDEIKLPTLISSETYTIKIHASIHN